MDQCKRDGCWSYAINDHKESGLCDKCYWIDQAEKLTAERDKLKEALEFCAGTSYIDDAHRVADEALKESA